MKKPKANTRAPQAAIPVPIPSAALPEWVTATMAARFTGVHRKTLRRAAFKGLIKDYKRNQRVVLYERSSLLRYYGITA